jgi:hypothetical protein
MKVSNGTITIDLRKATIRDQFKREALVTRLVALNGQEREINYRVFARVVTQATTIEGVSFSLPTEHDDDTALVAAWNQWIDSITEDIEDGLYTAFSQLMKAVDPATGPVALPEGTEKNS